MSDPDEAAIAWLLASAEPGIRYRTRVELLDEDPNNRELEALGRTIAEGPKCNALLQFGDVPPYKKWSDAHSGKPALLSYSLLLLGGAASCLMTDARTASTVIPSPVRTSSASPPTPVTNDSSTCSVPM